MPYVSSRCSSLPPSLIRLRNQQKQVTRKFSGPKQVQVKGSITLKNPTEVDGNDNTIHHPYILCHFADPAHHKTACLHALWSIHTHLMNT